MNTDFSARGRAVSQLNRAARRIPRRRSLEFLGAAVTTALTSTGSRSRACSLNDQLHVGIIGLGSRGFNLIDGFLKRPDCRIVSICDVAGLHYRDRSPGRGPAYGRKAAAEKIQTAYGADSKSATPVKGLHSCSDFRELIGRSDIDVVVVATPDHWHALCTLAALRARKDVYCEKPVTHLFAEGLAVIRERARHGAVFQTGSQQRSDPLFQRAVELARNGVLGKIKRVQVGLPPGYSGPMGSVKIMQPPADLDYDFWCGPSVRLPLMQARFHRWWRGHTAYGGGVLMDWIGHHNDIAHWAINADRSGPSRVEAVDWKFPSTDIYNTPHQYTIVCEYPSGVQISISSEHEQGVRISGEDGWVYVRRGRLLASDAEWLKSDFRPGPFRIPAVVDHIDNFVRNVRQRGECLAPPDVAHRSITPGHLGYVSHALGRPLKWDAEAQRVVGDEDANRLLHAVDYRMPWTLDA